MQCISGKKDTILCFDFSTFSWILSAAKENKTIHLTALAGRLHYAGPLILTQHFPSAFRVGVRLPPVLRTPGNSGSAFPHSAKVSPEPESVVSHVSLKQPFHTCGRVCACSHLTMNRVCVSTECYCFTWSASTMTGRGWGRWRRPSAFLRGCLWPPSAESRVVRLGWTHWGKRGGKPQTINTKAF